MELDYCRLIQQGLKQNHLAANHIHFGYIQLAEVHDFLHFHLLEQHGLLNSNWFKNPIKNETKILFAIFFTTSFIKSEFRMFSGFI